MMRFRLGLSGRLLFCLVASLLACVVGLLFAVCWGTASDGGRGGAVALAITFVALFMYSSLPGAYIEAPDGKGQPTFDRLGEERIARLRNALACILDRQRLESTYLTVSGVVGAVILGFGDLIAAWLGAPLG